MIPNRQFRQENPPGAEADAARAHRGEYVAASIGMEMVETTGENPTNIPFRRSIMLRYTLGCPPSQ